MAAIRVSLVQIFLKKYFLHHFLMYQITIMLKRLIHAAIIIQSPWELFESNCEIIDGFDINVFRVA